MNSKIYPIGVQNFESLRKDDYFYIDKTALVYQLARTGRYYFLSRPRRFGKSLLISTLEAYFQGKKELFEGLAIETLEKDWIKHPILPNPPSVRFPCVLRVLYSVPARRQDSALSSWWTSMTNPCCKPLVTMNCKSTTVIH